MSNTLKALLNPVEEGGDVSVGFSISDMSGVYPDPLYQPDIQPYHDGSAGQQLQSQYHGTGYIDLESDGLVMQPDVLPEMFGNIQLHSIYGDQTSLGDIETLDYAIAEWGSSMASSNTFDSSQLTPVSSLEPSHSPALGPESNQSQTEVVTAIEDDETICYGMLHNVDVKVVGDMQTVDSRLGGGEDGYERFRLKDHQDHIILCFLDGGRDFGYLRLREGKTLAPLLATSHIELEPIVRTFSLKEAIVRANKPSEAIVRVDINVYGRRQAAADVGNMLSSGKLWLQKSDHARHGVAYHNPHFLPLEIRNIQTQSVLPVNQAANKGISNKTRQEEQLRKMVKEVYKSVDNTRHLDRVEGGDRVTQELYRHQKEALGFMLERESGVINDRYRLWKMTVLEDGTEEYRHRITKAKRHKKPDERGGGILADEMGMGKSLSILALIAKTLDDGREWARERNSLAEDKNAPKYSRSTLVVVPSAVLINNWANEIQQHLKEGLKVIKYHGSDRPKNVDTIQDSDIVITTYSTLTTEFQNKSKTASAFLHQVDWYRVVLDEAHTIRRQSTKFYEACGVLHANSRWCLTGTPIQNKLTDIGALFAFIRVEPFSQVSMFRKWIEVPFEQNIEDPTVVKDRLVMLLEALCLCRTKEVANLRGPRQYIRELEFSPAEREQYENTHRILMRTIRHHVGEADKNATFGMFQARLQMCLLCNHGTFQKLYSWRHRTYYQDARDVFISALGQNGEITCSSCKQPMPILGSSLGNGFLEQCKHVLCSECTEESSMPAAETQMSHCPICIRWPLHTRGKTHARVEDGVDAAGDVAMLDAPARESAGDDDNYYFNDEGHSTKMQALIKDVSNGLWTAKSIIFSSWKRTLHLLAKHLDEAQIPHLRIDGGCSTRQREIRLERFAKEKQWPVLIMTTGTGAYGLNLTCANRVFIVEPLWNPSVESQAIARAIRLGQDGEVDVTRYVVKNTVEEDIMSQQQWKKYLAAIGFEDTPEAIDNEESVVQ